ncbi:hypothetical protein bpSLO_001163 (plasmid) [Borrelia parkeri]|uniref:BTA121 domain-containing protein surface lipoprotein n=1 Tax=Borrelia parkeri TaxID=141 RepID=UPI001FF3BEF1|nr:hypothetical protein [Borrelia parkeri]UPA11310.1 hypothetical protein bpSLO_001163 [Borrelia parkeri]
MLNIRHISLLLILIFLLLLVISCGSGNRAGAGTNTGTEEGTGLRTDVEVKAEEELAYLEEKVTDPRLLALLDNFGVSEAGRKAIGYIRENLTGDDVDNFFYNRLNELGADVTIKKIIKPTVSLLRARGEALRVIEGTTDAGVKTRLRLVFNRYDDLVNIREKFNNLLLERDIFEKTVTRYAPRFRKFKEMVKNPSVMDVYAWLDAVERTTINEIGKIVINATYDKVRFNNMLDNLGDGYIVRIIEIYRDIKIKQKEAFNAITTVSDDAVKQDLKDRLKRLKDEYDSHIRDAFNQAVGELARQILINRDVYLGRFNSIKVTAQAAKASGAAGGSS